MGNLNLESLTSIMMKHFNKNAVEQIMSSEPKKRKQMIACSAFTAAAVCLIFGAICIARLPSIGNMQTFGDEAYDVDDDLVWYDIWCVSPFLPNEAEADNGPTI